MPRLCLGRAQPTSHYVLIVEGGARIIGTDVPPSEDAAYVAKYERHLPRWDFTWDSYDAGYPVRVHIRPTRLRG